ncbi:MULTISPECIES: phosphoglycerate dehydrogenase [unclassified Sporolactobacillus]|uniref:phosphoglycerate dehydrogenase n=1 Tax=unclassified Sporolactobacillus TaxID=2628533 RepID=UPI0023681B79|nr:phosphoglycerate dehydrogenase [Sporolactobacillus sp. CQH2019]MDD9149001.1 phosphoglycerate dehydrogenase [Sporolactobacillus sp. CQH2019]
MNVLFCVGKSYFPIYRTMVDRMEKAGADVTCLLYNQAQNKETIKKNISDAEIYITAVAPADREVIDAAPRLKYILKTGTGLDNVDVGCATERGILVSNAHGENATSVAELAIGLMIGLSRMIPQLDRKTKDGVWLPSRGYECRGKTLGIIGFGSIGMKIAGFAGAFDMKVIVFGNYKDHEAAGRLGASFVELDQLLKEADYIVISTALTKSNYHLIDERAIAKMKPSAFLINISRGAIIDEQALFETLRQKKIGGAALDVFENEPPEEKLPDLDNLIATPHIGGMTEESVDRVAEITVENIRRFIDQESLRYVVNLKELKEMHKI